MNRGQKKWIGVCLFLFAVGGVCALALWKSTDPRLLTRATRITPLYSKVYHWRNPNSVLIHNPRGKENTHADVVELNCTTGTMKPVAVFNRDLPARYLFFGGVLSPDRKLCVSRRETTQVLGMESGRKWIFTDGGQFNHPVLSNALWFTDNRRWIVLKSDMSAKRGFYAVERSLNNSKPIDYPAFGYPKDSTYWDIIGSSLLGFIGKDRILALPTMTCFNSKFSGMIRLFEFSTGRHPNLKEYPIPIPASSRVWDVALSPNGKRLALMLCQKRLPPQSSFDQLMQRLWKRPPRKPEKIVMLYTLKTNGSDWHSLGWLPYKPARGSGNFTYSDRSDIRLQWLSDGKHLSFIHDDGLWTVPSD